MRRDVYTQYIQESCRGREVFKFEDSIASTEDFDLKYPDIPPLRDGDCFVWKAMTYETALRICDRWNEDFAPYRYWPYDPEDGLTPVIPDPTQRRGYDGAM